MSDAPFHSEIAHGPEGGYALWRKASDGVRLRIGFWPLPKDKGPAKGTVIIFTGRTEYIEKYGHVASVLQNAGYAVASLDWRGQGLSDRVMDDPYRGHIEKFDDYQNDVGTLLETLKEQDMPTPYNLIAHSMGGAIGLRALMNGMPVNCAVFSAPMWGILMAPVLRPVAWGLSRMASAAGAGETLAPGTNPRSFILNEPFENNTLTTDPDMWNRMKSQMEAVPELELGGPSLNWVRRAMDECADLAKRPSPSVPALTFLGSNERIVATKAVHQRMADWPTGQLNVVPNAEHEGFMESPSIRNEIFDQMIAFLDLHTVVQPAA